MTLGHAAGPSPPRRPTGRHGSERILLGKNVEATTVMSAGQSEGGRAERVVEVYDAGDGPETAAPSPTRTVAAAAVVVTVVAAVLSGLYLLAVGLLLFALAAAVATARTGTGDGGRAGSRLTRTASGLLAGTRDLLDRVRAELPGDRA